MCQWYAEKAENATLWDKEGNRYIDFAAGIAVVNTGHRHPKVIAAVKDQLDHFTHTCHQVVPYENYVRLAERLNNIVPIKGEKKTIFVTTGAEAVENAIKIARAATGRTKIAKFEGNFHGSDDTFLVSTHSHDLPGSDRRPEPTLDYAGLSPRLLGWWSPNPRGVLPLDALKVSKSLRQSARHFEIRIDTCFHDVIRRIDDFFLTVVRLPNRSAG